MTDRGNWCQTYTGRQFWPLAPHSEDIHIDDIAHALSLQCRFGGHCAQFYSVAEHSLQVSHAIEAACPTDHTAALWGLLHDAAEAYIIDIPRPLKEMLPGYCVIETRILVAIAEHYDLPVMPGIVKDYDNRLLLSEQLVLMSPPPAPWSVPGEPLRGAHIECLAPPVAEKRFINSFLALERRRTQRGH